MVNLSLGAWKSESDQLTTRETTEDGGAMGHVLHVRGDGFLAVGEMFRRLLKRQVHSRASELADKHLLVIIPAI